MTKVNILGTEYTIVEGDKSLYPRLENTYGYCDETIKLIVIDDMKEEKRDPQSKTDLEVMKRKIIRHELVHAFLFESGLSFNSIDEWASNEEMIDWIAFQLPKMSKVCTELEILD